MAEDVGEKLQKGAILQDGIFPKRVEKDTVAPYSTHVCPSPR